MRGMTSVKKKKQKAKLMRKYKNCCYCGIPLTKKNRSIEHVIPKVLLDTGANHISNLKLSCKECNNKRGENLVA